MRVSLPGRQGCGSEVSGFAAAGLVGLGISGGSAWGAMFEGEGGTWQPVDFAHNVTGAPAPVTNAVFGNSPATKTGTAICTTGTQTTANANTDCATPTAGP